MRLKTGSSDALAGRQGLFHASQGFGPSGVWVGGLRAAWGHTGERGAGILSAYTPEGPTPLFSSNARVLPDRCGRGSPSSALVGLPQRFSPRRQVTGASPTLSRGVGPW